MPMSSKFLTESTGEKIVKIGQYLAKIWTKYDSLVFLGHPVGIIRLPLLPRSGDFKFGRYIQRVRPNKSLLKFWR